MRKFITVGIVLAAFVSVGSIGYIKSQQLQLPLTQLVYINGEQWLKILELVQARYPMLPVDLTELLIQNYPNLHQDTSPLLQELIKTKYPSLPQDIKDYLHKREPQILENIRAISMDVVSWLLANYAGAVYEFLGIAEAKYPGFTQELIELLQAISQAGSLKEVCQLISNFNNKYKDLKIEALKLIQLKYPSLPSDLAHYIKSKYAATLLNFLEQARQDFINSTYLPILDDLSYGLAQKYPNLAPDIYNLIQSKHPGFLAQVEQILK